jgi:hypothetical protein
MNFFNIVIVFVVLWQTVLFIMSASEWAEAEPGPEKARAKKKLMGHLYAIVLALISLPLVSYLTGFSLP